MRRRPPLRPALVAFLVAAICAPATGAADVGSEQAFVADTNRARAEAGLAGYSQRADLTGAARRWARWMAAHRSLEHNPSFGSNVCCWRDLGENVGRGSSESALQRAFMASPEHRANILSSTFTEIGVGTARSADGRLYVDELFRRPYAATHATSGDAHASRDQVRAERPSTVALLRRRLAAERRAVSRRAAGVDAVRQSLLFVDVMRVLTA